MRKCLFSLLSVIALLALAAPARAQYTTISGTVVDPDGFHYSNGTITGIVIPANSGPWKILGVPYGGLFPLTNLDVNGSFSANIGSNNLITPTGTQWQFTVCGFALVWPIGRANQCFTLTATVTGATLDLSTALNAVAPRLTNIHLSGSGCTPTGGDLAVQTNHPDGTCYGSADFTWNDGIGKQLLLAGNGTNSATGTSTEVFAFGQTNSAVNATQALLSGQSNSATADGGLTFQHLGLIGQGNAAAVTSTNAEMLDIYLLGTSNEASSTGGAASLNDTEDIYSLGENNAFDSDSGSDVSKVFNLGEHNSVSTTTLNSEAFSIGIVGTNNFLDASGGFTLDHAYVVGANNEVDGTTGNRQDAMAVGIQLTLSNCSNCFMFGKNGTLAISNAVGIGISSTPETVITTGLVTTNGFNASLPVTVGALPAAASGNKYQYRAVSDSTAVSAEGQTCVGGSSNAALAFSNGTVWKCF